MKFTGTSNDTALEPISCSFPLAAEQKARTTYDNILRLVKDQEVADPIRFLRQREIVHFQRFGETNREHCSKSEHTNAIDALITLYQ